jgi:hypothetical protein
MGSGKRAASRFTVCIRDDDEKTFEFRVVSDSSAIMARVAAAVAKGRHVRCRVLAADVQARDGEERFLAAKGYTAGVVAV